MLGAVNDTPFVDKNKIDTPLVDKNKIVINSFSWEIKIIK
jgi:hypothetical protein